LFTEEENEGSDDGDGSGGDKSEGISKLIAPTTQSTPSIMLIHVWGFALELFGVHNCVGKSKAVLSHTWGIRDKVTMDYGGKLWEGQIVSIMEVKSEAKFHITVFFESDNSKAVLKTLLEHKLMKLGVPVFLARLCACVMHYGVVTYKLGTHAC
jgi:hypothetical protein